MNTKLKSVVGHGIGFSQKLAVERAYSQLFKKLEPLVVHKAVVSINLVVTGLLLKRATVVLTHD